MAVRLLSQAPSSTTVWFQGGGLKARVGILFGLSAVLLLSSFACSRDPNVRKQKYFESGKRYFAKGNYRAAAIQFTNATRVDPNFAEGHDLLAQCHLKLQDWNNAYQELNRTIELQPSNYRAQIDLINLLIAASQLRQAQEKSDSLLAADPKDPQVHAVVANLMAAQGNIANAIREQETAVSLSPGDSDLRIALGLFQIKAGQLDKAEATLKAAVEMDRNSVSPLIALGGYYLQFNHYTQAQQQFLAAKELQPTNPDVWSDLARVQLAQGNRVEAEHIMQEAKQVLSHDSNGYRLLGDFYIATDQMDKALAEYASLYNDHPDDVAVQKNYTQMLIIKGRLDEAAKLDESLLKELPKDRDGLLYKGQILNGQGHFDGAIQALEKILNENPDDATAHYHLGVAYNGLGNVDRAESEWRQAVGFRPDLVDAQTALAMVAIRKKDMNALAFIGEQVVQSQPKLANGYLLRAVAEIHLNRFAAANGDLLKAMQLAPYTPEPYIQTGNLRVAEGHLKEAEASYDEALKIDRGSLEALRALVEFYLLEKQPEKALARVDQFAGGNSSGYHYLRAVALLGKQALPAGEQELEKAISLDPSNFEAMEALARLNVARGSLDQAIAVYQKGLADNPNNEQLLVTLGSLLEAKGNLDAAEQSYTKALQLHPDNPDAANNLAYLLLRKGDSSDKALSLAQQARRAMPNSPNVADTLGWVYFKRGMYSQSAELFQEAVTKVPDNPTYQYHLGMAYQSEKRLVQARLHLERVLEIDPNYENASDVRKALAELRR